MAIERLLVPVLEPEVVQAKADKRYRGDDEKVPTTSIKKLILDGVEITSRYNKADEFELMQDVIIALTPFERSLIRSIWCDSKACNTFTITLRLWQRRAADHIAQTIEQTLLAQKSGHNGIWVEAEGDPQYQIFRNPEWGDMF